MSRYAPNASTHLLHKQRHHLRTRLLIAAVAIAVAVPTTLSSMGPSVAEGNLTPVVEGDPLPFDLPTAALRNSPRKAFANYVSTMPISIDNKPAASDYYQVNYMTPNGEGGRHAAWGGYLRDRPLPRPVRPEANWKLLDMQSEVRSAISAGLDGFTLVFYDLGETANRSWDSSLLMMQAAANVDPAFKIIPQPDTSSWSALGGRTPAVMAKYLAQLMSYSSAYRLADGRYVLSPFTAEGKPVSYWTEVLSILKNTHGKPVAFFPLVQDDQTWAPIFAPISIGIANWGVRTPAWNNPLLTYITGPLGRITKVHNLGQQWMQPISVQDQRPREGIFDEAENTTNLRNTWQLAMQGNAEHVHYTTWGDYPEGSVMAPTVKHGWSFLDISAYYLTKWKTGTAPTIVRDTVYLTHRTQFAAAKPSFPQTKLMSMRPGGSPVRDTIEALTFLTAPGTVTISVGGVSKSCQVAAGPDTCTVPLGLGTPSATVTRGGATVASVTSDYPVVANPQVQDLQYVAVSSRRQGTNANFVRSVAPGAATPVGAAPAANASAAGAPATATKPAATTPEAAAAGTKARAAAVTATAVSELREGGFAVRPGLLSSLPKVTKVGRTTTVRLTAIGDSFVNAASPKANYGASPSLATRGQSSYVSYIRFALPKAPKGKTLTKAVLRLRSKNSSFSGSGNIQDVRLTRSRWSAGTVTWDKRPLLSRSRIGMISRALEPNAVHTVPLRAGSLRSILGGNRTFAITGYGKDSFWFWSRNNPKVSYRPQLILTYR